MRTAAVALLVLAATPIALVNSMPASPGTDLILCERASNQRMAQFKGAESLGRSEAIALLFFCVASKTTDNASLRSDLLATAKRNADEARKTDPSFRVTEWQGDR